MLYLYTELKNQYTMSNKTKVVFLKRNNEVFAFFIEEEFTTGKKDLFNSYAHIGQHSACHLDYAKGSILATKEEYKELEKELTFQVGYELEIIDKLPQ